MRLQRGYEEQAAALPSSMPDAQQKPSSQTMHAIEGFNAQHRAKTLLEQHQDKLKVRALASGCRKVCWSVCVIFRQT